MHLINSKELLITWKSHLHSVLSAGTKGLKLLHIASETFLDSKGVKSV